MRSTGSTGYSIQGNAPLVRISVRALRQLEHRAAEPHIRSPISTATPNSLLLEVSGLGRMGPIFMAASFSQDVTRPIHQDPEGIPLVDSPSLLCVTCHIAPYGVTLRLSGGATGAVNWHGFRVSPGGSFASVPQARSSCAWVMSWTSRRSAPVRLAWRRFVRTRWALCRSVLVRLAWVRLASSRKALLKSASPRYCQIGQSQVSPPQVAHRQVGAVQLGHPEQRTA